MSKIINGKEIAQDLRNKLKQEISDLKNKTGNVPGLAVVQVGNVAASSVYVKAKTKSATEVGIDVIDHHLPEETTQEQLLKIAQEKMPDLNTSDPEAASKIIAGTARSMGVEVK